MKILAEKWRGVNSVHGFLTDLWGALGIVGSNKSNQNGGNSSRYAAFNIGNETIVTIRASAHNADAENYLKDGNVNGDSNISIVLQKRHHKNTFKANEEVKLEEYVYEDSKIASVENPLSQIAMSLIKYLTDGDYVDTTGVAIPHKSPITTESKTHKNMTKKTIKMNEAQLRKMIAEAINELDWKTYTNATKKAHKKFQALGNKGRNFNNDEYSKRFRQLNGFEDAAVDAFNDEYGYNSNDAAKDRYGMTKNGLSLYVDPEYKGRPISTFMEKGGKGEGKEYDMWPSLEPANAANIHTVKTTFPHDDIVWDDSDSDPQYSPQAVSARDRGNQEIKDYMAGNYKYRKGKGWQLKESQLRDMIAESIKSLLSEYWDEEAIKTTLNEGFFKNIFKSKNEMEPEGWYIYANNSRSFVSIVKANDPNIDRRYMHKLPGGPFTTYDEAEAYYENVLEKDPKYAYDETNEVRDSLLRAAKSAMYTLIKPQLSNMINNRQYGNIKINKREVAQLMRKSFNNYEPGGKKIIEFLKTGKEPDVEKAINTAYFNIRNRVRAAQPGKRF